MTTQKGNPPVLSHEAGPKNENLQTAIVANDGTDRQAFALLKWQAAKVQQTLIKTPGGYLLSRWNQTRHCSSLTELQTILARMGAKQ
jgi:hypothetical protein